MGESPTPIELGDCDHMPFRNRFDLGVRQSGKISGLGGLYSSRKLNVMLP